MAQNVDPVMNEFFDFSGASIDDVSNFLQSPVSGLLSQGIASADNEKYQPFHIISVS
jgi:hypothetical protein